MQKKVGTFAVVLSTVIWAASVQAANYIIDAAHSSVGFKVSHMVVSKVNGRFDKFNGSFQYEEGKPAAWNATAVIDATSINTSNTDRDNHLRNPDFFDVQKFPQITFKSTGVSALNGKKAKLSGLLMMHGVEKPVTLDLTIGGVVKDPFGNTRAGFEATGTVNRKDFGIVWNKVMETGGLAVGEDVEIVLNVEGIQEKAETPAPNKAMQKQPAKK